MIFTLFGGMGGEGIYAHAKMRLKLATTTSTENSGLLRRLLPPFEAEHNCRVDVVAVGTGRALQLGKAGDVDVVLVHAREREDAFVAAGYGVERRDLMYNDFVLVGPQADPAGVNGLNDASAALRQIARTGSPFISRGDHSGTHIRERELWMLTDLDPSGDWYLEVGRGMGEVLNMAAERRAYTLVDRGTWLAVGTGRGLKIMVEGARRLVNPYGIILVNPDRHPPVNYTLARALSEYLTSKEGHALINDYRINGERLFIAGPWISR